MRKFLRDNFSAFVLAFGVVMCLLTLLALSPSALASTDVYTLVPPEGSTAMNYAKGAYNEVGTLKVTADDTFDSEMKVDVTVQHDGKFMNTSDTQQSLTTSSKARRKATLS